MYNNEIFTIELDFSEDNNDPVKVFNSFKLMLESQIIIQTELIRLANPLQAISFSIEDIKKSSLLADITRKFLEIENDNELFKPEQKGDMNEYVNKSLEKIHIKNISLAYQTSLINLAKKIITLKKGLKPSKMKSNKKLLQQDSQIKKVVYKPNGITESEIKL